MRDNPIQTCLRIADGDLADRISAGGYRWFIIGTRGVFAVAAAGRGFGIDNLLARRPIPGLGCDGPAARAILLAA